MSESEQIKREHEAGRRAKAAALVRLSENIEKGRIEQLPAAQALIARMFSGVEADIKAAQEARNTGPGAKVRGWLRETEASVLAALTLDTVVRRCAAQADGVNFQSLANALGRAVVLEGCVSRAYKANPVYFQRTQEYLSAAGTTSHHHVERTMRKATQNIAGEDSIPRLLNREYIMLGKTLLQAALNCGLCETYRFQTRKGTIVRFNLCPDVMEFIRSRSNLGHYGMPTALMVCPPGAWDANLEGGYLTAEARREYPLVGHGLRMHTSVRQTTQDVLASASLIRAVNYLQAHAFRLDAATCALADAAWIAGGGFMDLPTAYDPPKPVFPLGEGFQKEDASEQELAQFQQWKAETRTWYTLNQQRRSKVLRVVKLLDAMEELKDRDVYSPVFVDWRTRLYYRGAPSPQGTDVEKAAMRFSKTKPLGREGVFWLKVHIANCMGQDKARFAERARWTEEHWEALKEAAQDPMNSDVYDGTADSPFMAYAAVQELLAAYSSGNPETYESGLVVHMDATCSGLQHFSAMLRDPVGGKFTNLVDGGGEQKADIYQHVAERITARLERAAENGCELSQHWLKVGITRAFAKKPCMTYVYGATREGMAEDALMYLLDSGITSQSLNTAKLSQHIVSFTFAALEDTVPAAAACMHWLKQRTRSLGKEQPLRWLSPIGAGVTQEYDSKNVQRVRVRSCGVSVVSIRETLPKIDRKKMGNGISPNMVHSLDAAHLVNTANAMEDAGLSLVAIHDSYGTHACDVAEMHRHIRESFVKMYMEHDPLQAVLKGSGEDGVELPMKGTLDLKSVLNSEFFFC